MDNGDAKTPEPSKILVVEDVMEILRVGKSTAYHTMQQLNKELKAKGYITHSGRIPRSYLLKRCGL